MNFRNEFDISDSYIYLNSGTHSICPRTVLQAQIKYLKEYEENPTIGLVNIWDKLWTVQKSLAAFFHADAKDIFLRSNVTQVINQFILGVELPKNAEILYSDLEYGAMKNICRMRAERDSLSIREFPTPRSADGFVEKFVKNFTAKTKLVLVSHIFTANGLIVPLEELARETSKRGILLVVDAAHAPGAIPLDFRKYENVDFYGANLHKWMMAPKGTAFGWVNPRVQEILYPISAGWTTYNLSPEHAAVGGGSLFQGKFSLLGCLDFSPFLAISDTLDFWQKYGEEKIRKHLYGLQEKLEGLMKKHTNLDLISPSFGAGRGPLLAYRLPAHLQERGHMLLPELYEQKKLLISVPFIGDTRCLRLSPHIYNTEAELEHAVGIIKGVCCP